MSCVELADAVVYPNLKEKETYMRSLIVRRGWGSEIYAVVIMFSYTVLACLRFDLGLASTLLVSANKVR